jgi:hypothetical protein
VQILVETASGIATSARGIVNAAHVVRFDIPCLHAKECAGHESHVGQGHHDGRRVAASAGMLSAKLRAAASSGTRATGVPLTQPSMAGRAMSDKDFPLAIDRPIGPHENISWSAR